MSNRTGIPSSPVAEYYSSGYRESAVNVTKPLYVVKINDPLLGVLFCTVDEAFTAEELAVQQKQLSHLHPVPEAAVPGKIRRQLNQVINDLKGEV